MNISACEQMRSGDVHVAVGGLEAAAALREPRP